jgi:hypothetical protein
LAASSLKVVGREEAAVVVVSVFVVVFVEAVAFVVVAFVVAGIDEENE